MDTNQSKNTQSMLNCAFPDGLKAHEYYPLLYILEEHMSFRSLAQAITAFLDGDFDVVKQSSNLQDTTYLAEEEYYALILHDVQYVASTYKPPQEVLADLDKNLRTCGLELWIEADTI